jgi:hypothetical protein
MQVKNPRVAKGQTTLKLTQSGGNNNNQYSSNFHDDDF